MKTIEVSDETYEALVELKKIVGDESTDMDAVIKVLYVAFARDVVELVAETDTKSNLGKYTN